MLGLGDHSLDVAVVGRVGLNGQPTFPAAFPLEHRQQQLGPLDPYLLEDLPHDVLFRPGRVVFDDLVDPVLPEVSFLAEDLLDDGGVAGGSHSPVLDGVGQLLN